MREYEEGYPVDANDRYYQGEHPGPDSRNSSNFGFAGVKRNAVLGGNKAREDATDYLNERLKVMPYESTDVLFDQMVELVSEEHMIEGALPISAGDLVKVTWNGAEYECTAFTGANNLVFFGNTGFMGGEDNGIPFAMATATIDGQGMFGIIAPHFVGQTVSVKVEGLVVKTIDPKFIPAGVGGGVVIVQDSNMASGVMPAEQAAPTATMNAAQIAEAVQAGKTVYFLTPTYNAVLLPLAHIYLYPALVSGAMTVSTLPKPYVQFGAIDESGYVSYNVYPDGSYYQASPMD